MVRAQQQRANASTHPLTRVINQGIHSAANSNKESWEYTSNDEDIPEIVQTFFTDRQLTLVADTNQSFTYSYTFSWPAE